jgi:hypothetical protein
MKPRTKAMPRMWNKLIQTRSQNFSNLSSDMAKISSANALWSQKTELRLPKLNSGHRMKSNRSATERKLVQAALGSVRKGY